MKIRLRVHMEVSKDYIDENGEKKNKTETIVLISKKYHTVTKDNIKEMSIKEESIKSKETSNSNLVQRLKTLVSLKLHGIYLKLKIIFH